jgi:hypothetical protein
MLKRDSSPEDRQRRHVEGWVFQNFHQKRHLALKIADRQQAPHAFAQRHVTFPQRQVEALQFRVVNRHDSTSHSRHHLRTTNDARMATNEERGIKPQMNADGRE